MKPEDLIKYVFREEGQDYEARFLKWRDKYFVQAKQRSMWLLKHFYPAMSGNQIGAFFGQKHDGFIHARDKVTNFIATEKKYSDEMSKYIRVLRGMMNAKLKINCTSVVCKMHNKRAILRKTTLGYVITLKRLEHLSGRDVILTNIMNISDEAMAGVVECFKILNK
jgi:hypothetical protein